VITSEVRASSTPPSLPPPSLYPFNCSEMVARLPWRQVSCRPGRPSALEFVQGSKATHTPHHQRLRQKHTTSTTNGGSIHEEQFQPPSKTHQPRQNNQKSDTSYDLFLRPSLRLSLRSFLTTSLFLGFHNSSVIASTTAENIRIFFAKVTGHKDPKRYIYI